METNKNLHQKASRSEKMTANLKRKKLYPITKTVQKQKSKHFFLDFQWGEEKVTTTIFIGGLNQ